MQHSRSYDWFLDLLMEVHPVQCCDCLVYPDCNVACDLKENEDIMDRMYGKSNFSSEDIDHWTYNIGF